MTGPLEGVDDFFETYWEQEFLHVPGQIDDVPVRLDDIDHLLADQVLTTTTIAMSSGGVLMDPRRFTIDGTPLVAGGNGVQTVVDPDRLLAEFQGGATAAFQRVEDHLPAAAEVARQLSEVVGHPVRGNLFLTPPGAPGLPPHIDGADVFVIQCEGVKRWEIWHRQVVRPLCEDAWKRAELTEPDYVIDLQPGDLLYLPRGWRHRVGACADTSLSASFNIRTVTRAHVARAALDRACDTEAIRLALTPQAMQDRDVLGTEIADVLAELSTMIAALDPLDLADSIDELVHNVRQPKPTRSIKDAIAAIGLTDHHRVRVAADVEVVAADGVLRRGDETVTPPAPFVEALILARTESVTVEEVRGTVPLAVAEPLLLKLLSAGWILAT